MQGLRYSCFTCKYTHTPDKNLVYLQLYWETLIRDTTVYQLMRNVVQIPDMKFLKFVRKEHKYTHWHVFPWTRV